MIEEILDKYPRMIPFSFVRIIDFSICDSFVMMLFFIFSKNLEDILFSCILIDPRNFTQLKDPWRELEISLFSYLRVFSN